MKAFYRQRLSESSCAKKETGDIDILVTSRTADRKIMQSIRIKRGPPTRIRERNQFSISTKVIPTENLRWLHFHDESSIQELSKCWINSPSYPFL